MFNGAFFLIYRELILCYLDARFALRAILAFSADVKTPAATFYDWLIDEYHRRHRESVYALLWNSHRPACWERKQWAVNFGLNAQEELRWEKIERELRCVLTELALLMTIEWRTGFTFDEIMMPARLIVDISSDRADVSLRITVVTVGDENEKNKVKACISCGDSIGDDITFAHFIEDTDNKKFDVLPSIHELVGCISNHHVLVQNFPRVTCSAMVNLFNQVDHFGGMPERVEIETIPELEEAEEERFTEVRIVFEDLGIAP